MKGLYREPGRLDVQEPEDDSHVGRGLPGKCRTRGNGVAENGRFGNDTVMIAVCAGAEFARREATDTNNKKQRVWRCAGSILEALCNFPVSESSRTETFERT